MFWSTIFPPSANGAQKKPLALVSADILLKLCYQRGININRANTISEIINDVCPKYGISTADIMHEFLANVLHESTEFSRYEENLNYSAQRIVDVWPHRFASIEAAIPYQHNPKLLANKVYGGRKDLGNEQPEDGFNFRGSGPIQITGRSNFTLFASYMRTEQNVFKTLEEWAEALRTNDNWGMHSACWLFAIAKSLIGFAINDNMQKIIQRINGGYTGMESRMKYYELCKQYIKEANQPDSSG